MSNQTLYVPTDSMRVLDAAWVTLARGRSPDRINGLDVRVGLADSEGKATWLATYTGSRQSIPASGFLRLTPAARLRRAIPTEGSVVAEVVTYGTPAIVAPLGVQLLVGSSSAVPAFRVGAQSQRDAADSLAEHVSAVGAGDQVVQSTLLSPSWRQAERNHSSAGQTVSSTTYVDSNVSVVVTKPMGARIGYVKATAVCTFNSTSGAAGSLLYGTIGDGTTDHDEQFQTTGVATALLFDHLTVTFAGTVTQTTTLKLRLKVDAGAASASVPRQTLAVRATWTT